MTKTTNEQTQAVIAVTTSITDKQVHLSHQCVGYRQFAHTHHLLSDSGTTAHYPYLLASAYQIGRYLAGAA
ncbi:hypothetical protein QP862_00170 [Lacticaseibacillus rhamnosus]|uniref:hypothetical protein n=1 Tax=Lacticaseibacillus rhamnosus TaxID=47715 RepID=UPI00065AD41D|nr:hypothetical protein [Lacticaseibacillus rhamnosus]KMO45995.1 hypothetical protein PY95_10140 [Lacticaseibacillus rhamnosus]MBM6441575.1 hypothetical protein [Lacticaseibacillus rhamnosus]MDK8383427.1 hypothetical protein [Lacticaseibacillus rhamnosus]MDK8749579.1 hypothetical protein [Lacticaseibacillus rhamnosus]OAT98750.1 hypothetical protein PY72_10140 [Lacticaseibacillus rhamnosus]